MKRLNDHLSLRFRVFVMTLMGVFMLCITDAYAGNAYTDGRAYLRAGSPKNAGKVYVSTSSSTPAASAYKACNTVQTSESTTPSASAKVEGEKKKTTYYFWAVANAGYKFTGWYDSNGALQGGGAANISASVTSGTAGGSDTHAYLDMHAAFIKIIQMGFVVPTNGTYDISHDDEAVSNYASITVDGKVVLTAHPADGYKLRGWYTTTNGGVTKNYFAFGSTCEPNFTNNVTIGAEFVPDDGKAAFWIKGTNKIFDDLKAANTAAASSSSKLIVVVSDGVVGAGTYTISSGVTLFIPYNETYDLMTTPKVAHYGSAGAAPALSAFRRLTLAEGATINVNGNICIGGQQTAVNGGSPTSQPCGAAGVLDMSRGGTINLKSGSNLYAWGFVKGQDMDQGNNTEASGVGVINAASGATVWEDFQCGEWRGGTASSTIYSNKSSWRFFPFQSYTIQNVEVPVNYASGSNLKCHWAIFGNGSTFTVTFPLVASSNSLFKLASGGTLRKWYDPTTDRVCYELGGTTSLDALNLNVLGESVSSSDYNLPIPANMHIILKSGNALTISKPMTAHAGAVVEVKSDATLNVNAKVYMYDADDWDTYCMYAYYYRTYQNLTSHYDRGTGTSKTNLEDATLIVDGTVNIANQCLYTTAHGASIIGNGGGTFIYGTLPSNTTMVQCKVLSDKVNVNIRSANLCNDNGSYTKGIASTTFKNVNGRWFTDAKSTEKTNHTYDFTYIKSGDVYGTAGTNTTVASCYSKDKTGLALQNKWANIKAEGCDDWWTGIDDSHLYNWTLNSAWHQYIKTGSTVAEEGEEPIVTYAGSDGKVYQKQGCDIVVDGSMENCLYGTKALVNGSFIAVVKNTAPDEGYHKSDAEATYYLCFDGCVWHPATRDAVNLYTVDGTKYIWYNNAWLAVEKDSKVNLYYSLSATNVRTYYEYIDNAWVLASPVAEVVKSDGKTEQAFSFVSAIDKAEKGGTNVTIRLLKDIKITSAFTYKGANNCSLDLNGFTLTGTVTNMIKINHASATFIIKDQSAAGTGKIEAKFSRGAVLYGLEVTQGHLMINSGTVHVENTHASQGACGVVIKTGHKFTMNGGKLEVVAKGESWGVNTESTTTSVVNINGGTIDAKSTLTTGTTGRGASSIYSLGGSININGGTLTAEADTLARAINITNANTTLTIDGGAINASANDNAMGVLVGVAGPTTNINGGTITATTEAAGAYAVYTYGTTTLNGGKIYATAKTTTAFGVYNRTGNTIINTTDTIHVKATTRYAYGLYTYASTSKLWVNKGVIEVNTARDSYGLNARHGVDTINGGEFLVAATGSTRHAYGIYLAKTNPKVVVNGGKFKVTAPNIDNAHINFIAADGVATQLSLAGGYYSKEPNESAELGTGTCIASGKSVKDVERAKEQAIYDAGYVKKIAGNEYTVTWKSFNGDVTLGTSQVESGQVPVWTGERPDYKDATSEREWIGWATDTWNRGTKYVNGTPLPAIAASDVTYYAACQAIYADVTAGGTTTRYNSAQTAWTEAMKHKQATIRILSNLGSEANVGNMTELVFNPSDANAIITLDLNGHIWTMGNHSTAAYNKNIFLSVQKGKLIVTDNSAAGNGYLMNKWACGENLICANVTGGELILQGGGLKVNNTNANYNAVGVQANGGVFTMTGGIVEAKKEGDAVTSGGAATGVYAYSKTTLSGGTINATHAKYQAAGIQVMRRNVQTTLEDSLTVNVNGCQAFGVYGYGAVDITGGTYNVTATKDGSTWSTARGIYMTVSGENYGLANVTGNPTFTVNGMNATSYGVYSYGNSNVAVNVDSGTFNVYITNGDVATGVTAQASGVATIKGGTFTSEVKTSGKNNAFGVWAQEAGVVNVEGGTFTAIAPQDGGNNDAARINGSATNNTAQLNISGGSFTMTKGGYAVRAFGGTTHISGNPTFTARYGIDIGSWAAATCTATMVVDGGTFNATVGDAVRCYTTSTVKDAGKATEHTDVVTGDLTIWDGKFHSPSSIKPVVVSATTSTNNIKIRGGYYSSYTSSNLSDLTKYVVSPSTAEALASGTTEYTEGYRYRVNTKYNVTFSVNGVNTVKQYNRNETPDFGSTPAINDGNTYDFIGWTPEIAPVTTDVTYTAQFKKWEAEIIMPNGTSKRYESFATAWTDAQQLRECTLRLLSNVNSSVQLTYNPAPPAGTTAEDEAYFTNATTTLDLNNHTLAFTGTANDRFLVINKTGSKFIIDDSSAQKNGVIKYESTRDGMLICVATHYGDLELRGGTILARNNNATNTSVGVYPCRATTFTMTDGNIKAYARQSAKGVYTEAGGTEVVNISGGAILASTEYDNSGTPAWGNYSYGVHIRAGAKATLDGTYTVTSQANQDAYGIYAEGTSATAKGEITVKSGTVTAITKTKRVFGAWVNAYGTINIEGGTIDAHSTVADVTSMWNVEGAHCSGNGILNISGGDISSDKGASPIGVSIHGGKTTITGGKITSKTALHAVDYATATQTATVIVNGGTFIATDCAVRAYGLVREIKDESNNVIGYAKNNANVTINGGYFYSTGSYIAQLRNDAGATPSTLVLNGGKYCEKSSTTFKNQINALKGSTTTVNDINETVDGKTYKYQLLTDFTVTWKAGTSYTKSETVRSGKTPSNTEVTSFVRNDSTFYFTGWTPTPSPVITDITYQAEGEYHVAKVKIGSGAWTIYDDFDEAWNDAMAATNANVNITLLNNVTLNDYLAYKPTIANARTTLDLNNFTLTQNSAIYSIHINKADAKLTITDTSDDKGGCIYKKMSSSTNIYGVYVYNGEAIMAGGKIYCENTIDDKGWHPSNAMYNVSANAKITITGGMVESAANITAYGIGGYGPVNISGGHIKATVKKYNNARALSQQQNTATITGGTFEAIASGAATGAYGVVAASYVGSTGAEQTSTVNISGGKFIADADTTAIAAYVHGHTLKVGETVHAVYSTLNISDGEFIAKGSNANATQIFAVDCDGSRLFDDATPHNMIGEARGVLNITGGTFLCDVRDGSGNLVGVGNTEAVRCLGTATISGGTFTLNTKSGFGCRVFRGTLTISGNPVFNINATSSARGIAVADWAASTYCHKENNLAEAIINGGTFNVTATGSNVIGAYAARCVTTTSGGEGYGMSGKITINGGEFICTGGSNVNAVYRPEDQTATYGTATATLIINGGKFQSRKGTPANPTYNGTNLNSVSKLNATGGYFVTNNSLATHVADTCKVTTLADTDPEYANGYRYKIEPDYVAKVSKAGASDRFFCVMKNAFDYAKTQDNSTITLLRTVDDYVGPTLYYNPSTAMSCTLDLNGFTFKGQATSVEPDRLLIVSKGGCTFTIKDSSTGKTGKFSHEKGGANFAAVVYHGTLVLESGTVHCKNTSGGAQALRSTDPDAIIRMTGGKAHAEATGTAYAVNSYGPATITGGLLLAEGADARGVNSQDANADVKVKGNAVIKAIASAETAYGLYVAGGGKLTISENACDTAICTTKAARGAYVGNGQLTISGNAKIRANAGTASYTVLAQGDNANATIEGGTITSYSSANSASITVYALLGATAHITGGTFYALDNISNASNVSPIRTGDNATMTIDGGTFYGGESGTQFQAVSIRGGETTINGGTFNAAVGIRAMDWADATTITGKLTVKGGTFNTTSYAIHVSSNNSNNATPARNGYAEVSIEGGKFKSTGSTLVQMGAAPTGTTASTLTITGGYFNEKSGTTFKGQITPYVADTCEINTLDPLFEGVYKYEVAPHYVASVTDGAVVTNYTTLKAAFDYAKTRNNSVVTLLDDCDFVANEQYGYSLCPSGKTMTLDLNNHTVNATSTDYDRVFGLSGQLTITDHSGSKNGKLSLTKDYNSTFIGIVFNDGAKLILEEGTIYVENERASRGAEAINVWGTTGIFTQTGGLVHVKASGTAKAFQHRGTINIEGGEVRVVSTTGLAIGDSPAAEDPSTGKIGRSNISGTAHFNISGQTDANGVYNEYASNVSITGGTFDVTANTNNAYGIRAFTNAATITVNGPVTINTTSTTAMAYSIHAGVGTVTLDGAIACTTTGATRARSIQAAGTATITVNNGTYKSVVTGSEQTDSYVLIPEGTSAMTVNGGKFSANRTNIAYKGASATLTINGGYFNEYSTGTTHKTQVETYCVAPKHCLPMTAAEIATVGADYKYKVVDAYTLTWTTDGDALTGTYTQGITAVGAAITAPATPTKTGYTFAAWTPAVAATMPAANTTYTATWTANTNTPYTVEHYQQNLANDEYTKVDADTESKKGTTAAQTAAVAKSYSGFTAQTISQATIAADGSTVVKVYYNRNSYDLVWNANGGAITGSYTSGSVKFGAAITAPANANVTRTGYTFAAWNETPATTMPASDKTYTAEWNTITYNISYTLNGGTVASANPATYNIETATFALNNPTMAGYTFLGWTGSNGTTPQTSVSIESGSTGDKTYTANWAVNVASVKIGSTTTYHTTLAEAFNKAEKGDNAVITMLQDVTGLTATLVYNPANAYTCTLDLNNHTISGAVTTENGSSYNQLLRISKAGSTFIITDNSGGENGKLHNEASINAILYGIYVDYGHLKVTGGVISAKNTDTSGKNRYTYGISSRQSASTSSVQVTITDGCVSAEGNYRAYALVTPCTTTISGGTIKAKATGSSGDARGIYVTANTDTITGNPTFYVEAYKNAYGVYATGITNSTRGTAYYGKIIVKGGVFNVSTTTTTSSYGAYVTGHTRTINVDGGSYNGIYGSHGELEISNGTFNVTAHTTTAIGVYCAATYVYTNTKPNAVEKQFEGNAKITGGTFHIKTDETTGTSTAEGVRSFGQTIISGGTFDIKAKTTSAYGVHVFKGKTTINGNPSFTVRANATVYGASAGEQPADKTGLPYDGELEINGGTFDVATTTKASADNKTVCGVRSYANRRQIKSTDSGYYIGNYASAGTVTVNGGEFIVDGYDAVYGIAVSGTSKYDATTIEGIECPTASATAKMTVNGGKFKVTGTTNVVACNTSATNANFIVEGGYYSVDEGLAKYVAPTKAASPYYCVPTTDADKAEVGDVYNYKVVADANTGFYADIVDVDNTNSKLILNVTGWASGGWPYTINGVPYYKDAASAAAAGSDLCREVDRTLKVPYTGAPGDNFAMQIQKASGDEISNRIYVIPQEIKSATSISANETKNLYVKGATLTVNANITARNIYVAPDAKLTINSGKTLTADTIFLRTTKDEAAEMENNGTIAGTTKLVYTRIIKDKDFHLFGLPLPCDVEDVHLSDGVVPQYPNGWMLRSYNEARRAEKGADDNNWTTLAADGTIAGGAGYEMFSASNYYREFYFPVNLPTTNKVAVTYHLDAAGEKNAGWNALVSPFTHAYENAKEPENLVVNWYMDGYGYYEQEIPSVIPPAKPFAFQATKTGYLSFEGTSIVAKMPRRAAEEEVQIQWINLDITDADGVGDQTSVYSHPTRYEAAYQAGIDVAKQSFEASRAILYSSHAYGEMAFAGVADSVLENGVALTIYSPKEQELTFSMRENEWLNRMEYVWLIDHETGAATDLLYDTYTFSSPAGTTRGRFTIQGVFKAPQITTDIEPTSDSSQKGREARKVLIDQKMYILLDGAMYDATGKRVNK